MAYEDQTLNAHFDLTPMVRGPQSQNTSSLYLGLSTKFYEMWHCDLDLLVHSLWTLVPAVAGVPRQQPHRRSGLATLPSVGAVP